MHHIHIDGSQGEGGGQVLRSWLALSLVTGKPFSIDNIRANRSKPGLMRQHLTAVQAAAEVGQCEVENATTDSVRLDFRPVKVPGGHHLADQLLLPLGIAAWQGSGASSFRTHHLTQHSLTHIDILLRFLDIEIKTENVNDRQVEVCLR